MTLDTVSIIALITIVVGLLSMLGWAYYDEHIRDDEQN